MSAIATSIFTGVGLMLVIVGIVCGVRAYVATVKEHDTLPVWPWGNQQVERIRSLWHLARSRVGVEPVTRTVAASATLHASASMTATATALRSDESLEERIGRLESRVEQAEQRAAVDRKRAAQAEGQLAKRLEAQGQRLDEADEQLRALTRSVAVNTARLQISGLLFVGAGTFVMTIPALVAVF